MIGMNIPNFTPPAFHFVKQGMHYEKERYYDVAIRKYETARMLEIQDNTRDWLGRRIAECHMLNGRL